MPLSKKAMENKKAYSLEYAKSHLKRVPLDLPLAKYDQLKAAATEKGESVNGYIKKAIDNRLENDF